MLPNIASSILAQTRKLVGKNGAANIVCPKYEATRQWRTEGVLWGFNAPPKFRSFDKAQPNSQFRGKYIRNNLIRIRVSRICKLSGTPD
jgi:hypothetical protein